MARASARHILVKTEEQCNSLKAEIENGAQFGELAQQHSLCPSGKQGGVTWENSVADRW
jgi:peptidyl-prolyl cis-trans isomerase C